MRRFFEITELWLLPISTDVFTTLQLNIVSHDFSHIGFAHYYITQVLFHCLFIVTKLRRHGYSFCLSYIDMPGAENARLSRLCSSVGIKHGLDARQCLPTLCGPVPSHVQSPVNCLG